MVLSVSVIDYGAGNVRSLLNALKRVLLGMNVEYDVKVIATKEDIETAERIVFPGVGAFGSAMESLNEKGLTEPIRSYVASNRPFLGICLGMQTLFECSDESKDVQGLGIIPGRVRLFDALLGLPVPHMGWNGLSLKKRTSCDVMDESFEGSMVYFVHSYAVYHDDKDMEDWTLSTTRYGIDFVSSVHKGNVFATQFHPEKSGTNGLRLLQSFLIQGSVDGIPPALRPTYNPVQHVAVQPQMGVAKRVIACLDVRSNDDGELIVTKGDQYDVREKATSHDGKGQVRCLGDPVRLAQKYYEDGADEIVLLNITSFRNCPIDDLPMLSLLKKASENVFVPLTVGGGIKSMLLPQGEGQASRCFSAVEVAGIYFRSGADKVSIGSDAVIAAQEYCKTKTLTGVTSIESISRIYGKQAVVVSIDPRRRLVASADAVRHFTYETAFPDADGNRHCWHQCTVKGGREDADIGAYEMAIACQELGAGEIMLNSIDKDGTNSGFDTELISAIKSAVSIPVIASSGAGHVSHFVDVFQQTNVDAALAAGIFHRCEVKITDVKTAMRDNGIPVRL